MPSYYVYILYSSTIDKFYIGQTENIERRLKEHNTHFFETASTRVAKDWILYLSIQCQSRSQAIKIESNIKRSKSRNYIKNIKKYPEIVVRLLEKYSL